MLTQLRGIRVVNQHWVEDTSAQQEGLSRCFSFPVYSSERRMEKLQALLRAMETFAAER